MPLDPARLRREFVSIAGSLGKIRVLPGEMISRIAAGEVIERPAAVVKELIDNSMDAGSSKIIIEVADGGRALIRVTDDGEGMSAADAVLAFQRHATSKLRQDSDLASIDTMGFRGEALPSIASVSHVQMITTYCSEPLGLRLTLHGGSRMRQEEVAAARGTQIEVSDLFFNTPARKKFLKTAGTEFSHICQVVQQAALARPAVQFRLKHNGQDVLQYPPAGSLRDRVLQIYGSPAVERMTMVRSEGRGVYLEGLAVRAVYARAGRSPQELFVNRRPVKNATVSHAIYEGYGPSLPKRCHPVFVLWVDIDPSRVDVNVHPTKREVRFADHELIHQTVKHAIKDAVGADLPQSSTVTRQPVWHGSEAVHDKTTQSWRDTPASVQTSISTGPAVCEDSSVGGRSSDFVMRDLIAGYQVDGAKDVTALGQINYTFLVAQVADELHVIDQHTAHERILYERLLRAWRLDSIPKQQLLIPESIEATPQAAARLQRHLDALAQLGLEIEPFGGAGFLIRAIPALLGHLDYGALVDDLVEDLEQWESTISLDARIGRILASLACHAAVRAGRPMAAPEIKRLIEEWVHEGRPSTCPHGRRVALRFSAEELAKIFGR